MKVLTVVGARPQFIKESVVFPVLSQKHNEVLVHTGQHYDYNMSEVFFKELGIPKPMYNLGISGGTHAEMTGRMMIELEKVMIAEKPDVVLVYGDTNSTLAAVLAASKLHIFICHVEAGARTHCRTNPEEINRICADHLSDLLLTSTAEGVDNLQREGLGDRAYFVGDPMYDAFIKYKNVYSEKKIMLKTLSGEEIQVPDRYYYVTCHREENTINDKNLSEILNAMSELDAPAVYPVHPRNRKTVVALSSENNYSNILFVEPVGYFESISLVSGAEKVVTDSGGVQKEAFFAGKKCVTILDFECWPETMVDNRNELSGPRKEEILSKLSNTQTLRRDYMPFGDGNSAQKIVNYIEKIKSSQRG